MAVRQVVKFGDDVLRKKCRPVTVFDARLHALIDDMRETLIKEQGAGLAAPQVGVLRRVVIIDVRDSNGIIELINPEIISASGSQTGEEGCLSNPGVMCKVKRPNIVEVKAQDRNGNEFTLKGTALLARAICHETDHLDGILFTDRVDEQAL